MSISILCVDRILNSILLRRGDVPDLTADPSLAEKELGFRAPQDLETMCRDLWNWQTKNPDGYASPAPTVNGVNGINGCTSH